MFEQAVLRTHRRPWTLAASLTLQSAFAGAVVLLSVITIERLPSVALPVPLPPLPAAPKPVEIVGTYIERVPRPSASGVFFEPARIPKAVAMVVDEVVTGGGIVGAVGGLVGTGLPAGMYATVGAIYNPSDFKVAQQQPAKPAEPVAKPLAPPKMITVGGVVLEGKIIRRVIPTYPQLARQARVSGTVKLSSIIARDGTVRELKVISGHALLVNAAVDAVRQWLYQPTLLNGEPVEVNAPIDVHFNLMQ